MFRIVLATPEIDGLEIAIRAVFGSKLPFERSHLWTYQVGAFLQCSDVLTQIRTKRHSKHTVALYLEANVNDGIGSCWLAIGVAYIDTENVFILKYCIVTSTKDKFEVESA